MKTLEAAQKDLDTAIETMKQAKQENSVKCDWPEVKRTFTYKKDGSL